MTPTYIQNIREKCVLANPEIVALKFGCKVENFLKGTAIILKVHKYQGESDCYDVAYYKLPELIVERTPFNNWKILGRDITLADVLLAVEKNALKNLEERGIIPSPRVSLFGRIADKWDFFCPLHEQSETVLQLVSQSLD